MNIEEKSNYLRNISLLKNVSESGIREIVNLLDEVEINQHEIFISQDETALKVYFIIEGVVRVYRITENGDEIGLSILGSGEIIGELAFLDHENRSANVQAMQNLKLFTLSGKTFEKLLYKYPQIGINLLKVLSKRIKENGVFLEEALSKNLKQRTWDMLKILTIYFPHGNISISQEELSLIIGATRSRVTEVLNILQQEGKIKLSHKNICVI